MPAIVVWAIRVGLLLNDLKDSPLTAKLRAEVNDLREKISSIDLPPPPNGVAWTMEDLQALGDEIHDVTDDIRGQHGG